MVHRSESDLNFDNIIFAERNQSYGAFDLRNVYNSHLKKAVFISAVLFTTALLSPKIISLFKGSEPVEEEFTISEVVLSEPPPIDPNTPPPPPPPPVEPPRIASVEFLPPKIMEDDKVVEEKEPPKQTEMEHVVVSDHTQDGLKDVADVVNVEVEDKEEQIFILVTEPSEFSGGKEAYEKFLGKHLTFPSKALENNHPGGKVYINFVVEKDGSITDVKVAKGLSPEFNEEAIRVIKMTSGKWSLAKNNGVAVRAKKSLTVTFKVQNN